MPDQTSDAISTAAKGSSKSDSAAAAADTPKTKNKLTPVVVALAILAVGGLIFGTAATVQNFARQDEIKELEAKVAVLENNNSDEDSDNGAEGEETSVADRAQILAEVPESLAIDSAKCLNCETAMVYSISSTVNNNTGEVFSATTESLMVNWDKLKESGYQTDKTGWEQFKDLGISGQVTDVFVAGFGQAFGYETAFFLLEDGSVEYIPIYKALKANNVKSFGKLSGVENVIKFYRGGSCPKDAPTGCGNQTLAQRADGKFYELYSIVEKAGGFEGIF